jgi:hypothetical protein
MSLRRTLHSALFGFVAGCAVSTSSLAAQAGPGQQDEPEGVWAPPSLGARIGWDNKLQSQVLGFQLRLPVLPGGEIEVMPNMDITFQLGQKDYEYNLEAVYVLDGRAGGVYGGGGLAIRNFGGAGGRRTEKGFSGVIGFRLIGLGLVAPQVEYRWILINRAPLSNYQQLSFGVNVSPWQPVRDGRF